MVSNRESIKRNLKLLQANDNSLGKKSPKSSRGNLKKNLITFFCRYTDVQRVVNLQGYKKQTYKVTDSHSFETI